MGNISVIGAGYVGLVTATCFAVLGHKVSLLEIDPEKLSSLEHGVLSFSEPGLTELWRRNWSEGRLDITGDYTQGLLGTEFAFIAVGTPSTRNGKPDLQWVCSKELDMSLIFSLINRPIIIDGRNLYDAEEMIQTGFIYEGTGRPGIGHKKPEAVLVSDGEG